MLQILTVLSAEVVARWLRAGETRTRFGQLNR